MRSVLKSEDAALDAVDLVALVQQELREVCAVLAGDAGNQCGLANVYSSTPDDALRFDP